MSLPFPKDEISMPDSSIRGMARWCCLLYKAATKHWKALGPLLGIISTNFSARSPLVLLAFTASLSSSSRHSDRSFNTFKGSKSLIRSTRCLWRIFLCSSDMPAIFKRYKFAEAMSFTWFYRADSHISTFVVLYSVTSLLKENLKNFSLRLVCKFAQTNLCWSPVIISCHTKNEKMSLQYNKETILWSCTSHLIIRNVCKFQDGRRSRAVFSNFLLNSCRLPWKMQCALVLQTMVSDTGMDINSIPVQIKAKKPWRKVLYEDQGVPDNYVDESFLDEMKKNCKCV